jgi:hypothetical protein
MTNSNFPDIKGLRVCKHCHEPIATVSPKIITEVPSYNGRTDIYLFGEKPLEILPDVKLRCEKSPSGFHELLSAII